VGGHTSWARTDNPTARTAPARTASYARFLDEVDPHHELSDAEGKRRGEHLHKAHMSRLALRSVESRRKAVEARRRAAELERAADTADVELGRGGVA
jgi:hypothetical protein